MVGCRGLRWGQLFLGFSLAAALATPARAETIRVAAGESIQDAIDAASPGDTVEVTAGLYRENVTVSKAIELVGTPAGEVLLLGADPAPTQANEIRGDGAGIAIERTADVRVAGFDVRYFETGIAISDSEGILVENNRVVSCSSAGIQSWDTRNVEIRYNELIDPFLEGDPAGDVEEPGVDNAHMDYGTNFYGTIGSRVHHNYYFGVFNQACSFKDGNTDAYAAFNTFEGFLYTALWFGQNPDRAGSYDRFGQDGVDNGTIQAVGNVFRPIRGPHAARTSDYRARTPMRVWHVDGEVILRDNIVEMSLGGIYLQCGGGICPVGTIRIQNNLIGGTVHVDGTPVTGSRGIAIDSGDYEVIVSHTTLAHNGVAIENDGADLTVVDSQFYRNQQGLSGPATAMQNNGYETDNMPGGSTNHDPMMVGGADLALKTAQSTFDPNRTLACAFHLTEDSPDLQAATDGSHVGAYGLEMGDNCGSPTAPSDDPARDGELSGRDAGVSLGDSGSRLPTGGSPGAAGDPASSGCTVGSPSRSTWPRMWWAGLAIVWVLRRREWIERCWHRATCRLG